MNNKNKKEIQEFNTMLQEEQRKITENKEEQDIIKYRNKKSGSLKVCILAA